MKNLDSVAIYLQDSDENWVKGDITFFYSAFSMWFLYGGALGSLGDDDESPMKDKPFRFKIDDHEFYFIKDEDFAGNEIAELYLIVREPKFSDLVASVELLVDEYVNQYTILEMLAKGEQSQFCSQIMRVISEEYDCGGLDMTESGFSFCGTVATVTFKDGMKLKVSASEFGGLHFDK